MWFIPLFSEAGKTLETFSNIIGKPLGDGVSWEQKFINK
jgi:hypothetical protein